MRNNNQIVLLCYVNGFAEDWGVLRPAYHLDLENVPYKRNDGIRHASGACGIYYLMRGDLALNPHSLNGHAEGDADAQANLKSFSSIFALQFMYIPNWN